MGQSQIFTNNVIETDETVTIYYKGILSLRSLRELLVSSVHKGGNANADIFSIVEIPRFGNYIGVLVNINPTFNAKLFVKYYFNENKFELFNVKTNGKQDDIISSLQIENRDENTIVLYKRKYFADADIDINAQLEALIATYLNLKTYFVPSLETIKQQFEQFENQFKTFAEDFKKQQVFKTIDIIKFIEDNIPNIEVFKELFYRLAKDGVMPQWRRAYNIAKEGGPLGGTNKHNYETISENRDEDVLAFVTEGLTDVFAFLNKAITTLKPPNQKGSAVTKHYKQSAVNKSASSYKKTARKHTDSNGNNYVIYKKGDKYYIKKKSKSTCKFTYRPIKV